MNMAQQLYKNCSSARLCKKPLVGIGVPMVYARVAHGPPNNASYRLLLNFEEVRFYSFLSTIATRCRPRTQKTLLCRALLGLGRSGLLCSSTITYEHVGDADIRQRLPFLLRPKEPQALALNMFSRQPSTPLDAMITNAHFP
jgi:hypothetical protein